MPVGGVPRPVVRVPVAVALLLLLLLLLRARLLLRGGGGGRGRRRMPRPARRRRPATLVPPDPPAAAPAPRASPRLPVHDVRRGEVRIRAAVPVRKPQGRRRRRGSNPRRRRRRRRPARRPDSPGDPPRPMIQDARLRVLVPVVPRGALLRDQALRVRVHPRVRSRRGVGEPPRVVEEHPPRADAHLRVAVAHHVQDRVLDDVPGPLAEVPLLHDEREPPGRDRPQLRAAILGRGVAYFGDQMLRVTVVQDAAHAEVAALGDDLHGDHDALKQLRDVVRRFLLELAAELRGENDEQVRHLAHDRGAPVRRLMRQRLAQPRENRGEVFPLRRSAEQQRLDPHHRRDAIRPLLRRVQPRRDLIHLLRQLALAVHVHGTRRRALRDPRDRPRRRAVRRRRRARVRGRDAAAVRPSKHPARR